MPMNTPADHLAADLMESYEQNGALAKAFDSQIAKLETKARELQRKKDKESILLTNTVFGMLRSTKLLRDRVLRAAKAKALKEQKEKKYLKDARLAAGYYMASVQMFKTLSVMNPKLPIDVYEKRGQFGVVFHDVFDEYMKEYRKVSERRFIEFSKSIGLDIKTFKSGEAEDSEWEIWSHSDKETDDFEIAAETAKQREAILQEWELVPGKDDETASQWEESDEESELSDEAEPEPTREKHSKKHHKDEKSKEKEPKETKEEDESVKRKKTLTDLKNSLPTTTSLGI